MSKVSKEQWRKYLEACDYQPGDCVMYVAKHGYPCFYRSNTYAIPELADVFAMGTPLRIFTPDGKTQRGVDYVAPKSKRERVREQLHARYMGAQKFELFVEDVTTKILEICEVEDADK